MNENRLFSNIENVFLNTTNAPTGVEFIDEINEVKVNGSQINLILTPNKIDGLTILNKIAYTSYSLGKNVLHLNIGDYNEPGVTSDLNKKRVYALMIDKPLTSIIYKYKSALNEVKLKEIELKELGGDIIYYEFNKNNTITYNDIVNKIKELNDITKFDTILIDFENYVSVNSKFNYMLSYLNKFLSSLNIPIYFGINKENNNINIDELVLNKLNLLIDISISDKQRDYKLSSISIYNSIYDKIFKLYKSCKYNNNTLKIIEIKRKEYSTNELNIYNDNI